MASMSSCMNLGERLIRETTTPGISSSSTSWSTRANVIVNSYSEWLTLAKLAYFPPMSSGEKWMLMWRSGVPESSIGRLVSQRADRCRRRGQVAATFRRRRPALSEAARAAHSAGAGRDAGGGQGPASPAIPGLHLAAASGRGDAGLDRFQPLPGGATPKRPRPVLRDRRAIRARARRGGPSSLIRDYHLASPAGARRAARTALPRTQDPRRRAVPLLTRLPSLRSPHDEHRPIASGRPASRASRRGARWCGRGTWLYR